MRSIHRRRYKQQSIASACLETLEQRRLLAAAPLLDAIADVTVPAGKSLILPLTASDADGDALAYNFQSSDPNISVHLHTGNPWLRISVAGFGDMDFQLLRDVAPNTVDTIAGLVQGRFYNGLTFHRIIQGFVIQGGDPLGTGAGGPDFQFDDEFNINAIFTGRGQLAMAKSGDDTNGSQFFVTAGQPRHLDFNHTIFGQLVRGFDVFEQIISVPVNDPQIGTPLVPPVITSARLIQNRTDAVITITAAGQASGTITVTVSDGVNQDIRQFAVQAVPDFVDNQPFLGPVSDVVTPVNTPVVINLTAIDLDGGDPIYATSAIPPSQGTVSVVGNRVTVTPAPAFTGPIVMAVGVRSATSDFDAQTITIGVGDRPIVGQILNFSPTAGQPGTFNVASFTNSDPAATADHFTATINWGDGQVTLNAPIVRGPNNTFLVNANHAYRGNGTFPLKVTVTGKLGATAKLVGAVTVADAPLTAQGTVLAVPLGQPLSNVQVATFVDADPRGVVEDHSAIIDWGDGQVSAGTVVLRQGGGFAVLGSHTYQSSGAFPVTVTINDVGGSSATANSTVQVGSADLPVDSGPDATINEGGVFTTLGSFSDQIGQTWTATVDYGQGQGPQPLTLNPDKTFTLSAVYLNSGTYTVSVVVTDQSGRVGVDTVQVTVNNVGPTANVGGDRDGVRFQGRTITLAATDPSPEDQLAGFHYVIDWGDGTSQVTDVGSSSASHAYRTTGNFTVTVRAVDQDGTAGEPQTHNIRIAGAQLQVDPRDPSKRALAVGGTAGNDNITLSAAAGGRIRVQIGSASSLLKPTGSLLVYGADGNDTIRVDPAIRLPAELYGGNGNDRLFAGSGNSILVGGAGKDRLEGGAGRNILIGGAQADTLIGGTADDLLIAGSTAFDDDPAGLRALLSEWQRTNRSYAARVKALQGVITGANGGVILSAQTVFNDAHVDVLTGGNGNDLFLFNNGAGAKDRLTDRLAKETAINIGG